MRALITGIRGAAGSYLAEHLRARGTEVFGMARPECNLLDFEAVHWRLMQSQPKVIYHLASRADVRASFDDAAQVFGNNTLGTVNLFEAARKARIDPVIVLCSSSEVYGNPNHYPIGETWPMNPVNPYAVSKASQDLLGQMYASCYGMKVVITRAFGYVNPRRPGLSLSNFARQIVEIERGERVELLHGNLDSVRTFCDVRDIVDAYEIASHCRSGIYNIGSEEPVTVGHCLTLLIGMAKATIRTRTDPRLMRPSDVTNQIPDCGLFTRRTGWKPKIALVDSLAWLLESCRAEAAGKVAA